MAVSMVPHPEHDSPDILAFAVAAREKTACEFDKENSAALDDTIGNLNKILTFQTLAILKGCNLGTGVRFDVFALSRRSLDVLVSAVHMARQRAHLETIALLRVALETVCTALHIYKDAEAYNHYRAGSYNSTKAISPAKTYIPLVGELYGAFSAACIHPNQRIFGPRWEVDTDGTHARVISIRYGVRSEERGQDKYTLNLVSLVALIQLKTLEITLTQEAPDAPEPWRSLVGTRLRYFHGTDGQIEKCHRELTQYGPAR
jgi:hypothetical protein